MSAPLVYWQGDAYAWDDGELVAVHNVGDVAHVSPAPVMRTARPAPVRASHPAPGAFPWSAR